MRSVHRLVRDESGMTMGLAVITMVLVGVMGAGLLTFVQKDLDSVVESNQGERAFEQADAGVQAAKQQLNLDSIPGHYDGGADDVRWSADPSMGGVDLSNLDGISTTSDAVNVAIKYKQPTPDVFVVISTGTYGGAKRKIEAVFKRTGGSALPPAYFTRSNLFFNGNITSDKVSYFALLSGSISGASTTLGTNPDVLGKWAEKAGDSNSYPNAFNATPRSSALGGIAVGQTLSLTANAAANIPKNSRSFDISTNPRVVANYQASKAVGSTTDSSIIAFPFDTSLSLDPNNSPYYIESLRQEAQKQQAANPSEVRYRTVAAGNSVSIGGSKGNVNIDWPSSATYETVVFVRFASYNPANVVSWDYNSSCNNSTRRGVIVVENGDFEINSSSGGFNGTVVTWGGVVPGTSTPYNDRGKFTSKGGACMVGYANASGDMSMSGDFSAGTVPGLSSLSSFAGGIKLESWRELYS